nr:peptidoglycan-binding protein [Kibdelosporangium sp. MJ126-NF4]CEL15666.1 N-acetylmuramoyl-L-alanine amidase, major autolysin [KO:K01448] [Kibdelosporangium sp. MJ126-NF4]CTQ93591.1 N-acetylmuramoyl-L-alanine amidase, major autolysin [EC:3.5.1.28] [KO:K01448] [Kibdelosporangium sp. MJ126-NF4]
MRKFLVRAIAVAVFSGGMAITTGIIGAGTAMACGEENERSDRLAASMPQVNPGDTGQHVLALQLSLRTEGYKYLNGTGNYVGNTLTAVKDFQQKNGINPSGIVGSKTWHALVGQLPPSLTGNGNMTPPNFGITPGETNSDKMGYLYNAVMRIHPYRIDGSVNDTYEGVVLDAVKDFQRRAGINPSGIVGPKTWDAMYEVIAASGQWGC